MAARRTFFNAILAGSRLPLSRSTPSILKQLRPSSIPRIPSSSASRNFHTYRPHFQQYRRFAGRSPAYGFAAGAFRRWSSRPTFYYEVGGLGVAGGGFYIFNLETVPVSGRRRFNVISPSLEESMAQGQQQQILQQYRGAVLPEYDDRVRQVRRVLDRLIPQSGLLKDKEWTVNVIEDEQANAFVIPGGHVFVFSGILPICNGDDGLATVLGHEIGHNVAHHTAEKLSRYSILTALAVGLEIFGLLPTDISRVLTNLVFEMPASRGQESEADYLGLMMMAESCYDPNEAINFWSRMSKVEERAGSPPEMLSTHPSSHNRQEKLRELLPKAQAKLEDSECGLTTGYIRDFRQSFA